MSKNIIYRCSVNGVLGRRGKYFAFCPKIKCGNNSICGAHGNTKCKYKIREVVKL